MTDILIQKLLDKVEARMIEAQRQMYEIYDRNLGASEASLGNPRNLGR
jgi:hypothetical protein